jgi:hypothetical protein
VAPTLDETASTLAVLTFFTLDGGTVWYGFPTGGGGVSGGTPALTLGTTNATGTATTGILTDASIAVFDATVPTTAAASDAAATGSAAFAARRDHRHGMPAFAGELLVADGTTGPSGITPTSYVEMTTPDTTTSASLEDITGATTTITLQRTSHIAAWLNLHVSASATCDYGVAINFNGTDEDEGVIHLTATDEGNVGIVHRTTTELPPGTYTIKGRHRRISGGGTPETDRADLLVMAMGHSGPVMLTSDDETDYLYADT